MHDTLVGVDIAKAVLQLALSSRPGRFDSHRRLSREQFPAVCVRDDDYRSLPAAA